ncbi:RNA polymerase sigma factor [uncultured Jatrophihabitans sp.]|uniref:RNA polymerase sigma factor n=1 Tax=uncultured Jatrophihabitans sp. TaxID=1610747 RepID=UPI0035CA1EF7
MAESSGTRALVRRARGGDVAAFEQLAREHASLVFGVALRIVGDPQDAQDVAQQALLSAWQGLATFRGEAAFGTWLFQITRRHALNSATRSARTPLFDGDDDLGEAGSDPAEIACERDKTAAVRASVAALPADDRCVVQLYHFHRLTYKQIAVVTDSTPPAVRSRLFRARRSLASALVDQR